MSAPIVYAAIKAVESFDKSMCVDLPEEIADAVHTHAGIAVASAWIPVSGLDGKSGACPPNKSVSISTTHMLKTALKSDYIRSIRAKTG